MAGLMAPDFEPVDARTLLKARAERVRFIELIYLSDPNRTPAERLRTIIRQPVEPRH